MLASHYEELIHNFLVVDSAMNLGRAGIIWPVVLARSFAELVGLSLTAMLVAIVLRSFQNRGRDDAPKFDFVEIFAGVGHLSREMIRAGYVGAAFDINFDPTTQDALQGCGLKLFVDSIGHLKHRGLAWLATQCSSYVVLCRHQSQRLEDNLWLGPSFGEDAADFVKVGNGLMEVSSLLFFLCYLLEVWVVLEQPISSCMPETPSMKGVLFYTQSARYVTYMGSFNGPSTKPLQLFSTWPAMSALVCPRPATSGEALVKKHGDQFTGIKELLVQSQAYTPEFGRKVAEICRNNWQG